jgi:hypothetical protein
MPDEIRHNVVERFKSGEFVKENREILLQHWNGVLDSKEAIDLLKKV